MERIVFRRECREVIARCSPGKYLLARRSALDEIADLT